MGETGNTSSTVDSWAARLLAEALSSPGAPTPHAPPSMAGLAATHHRSPTATNRTMAFSLRLMISAPTALRHNSRHNSGTAAVIAARWTATHDGDSLSLLAALKLWESSGPGRLRALGVAIHGNRGSPLRRVDSRSPSASLCGSRASNVRSRRPAWQYPFGSVGPNHRRIFYPSSDGCRHLWVRLLHCANARARSDGRQCGACAIERPVAR